MKFRSILCLLLTLSRVKATEQEYAILEPCENEYPFQSMEFCRCYCFFHFGTERLCKTIDWDKVIYNYKSVYFDTGEYEIAPNNTLSLKISLGSAVKSQFTHEEYFVLNNNSLVLCLRLNPEFSNCTKISIESDKLVFASDRSVYGYKNFSIDSYVENEIGIEVCSDSGAQVSGTYAVSDACEDGETFDTIETCACYCFFDAPDVNVCDGINYDITLYKSVYLTDSEYRITTNETLVLFGKNEKYLTKNEYFILKNNSYRMVLCYPLRDEFVNCSKNSVKWDEVELRDDKTARVTIYDKIYNIDSYATFSDGIVICANQYHHNVVKIATIAHACSAICLLLTFILALVLFNRPSNFALLCYLPMLCFSSTIKVIHYCIPDKGQFLCPFIPLVSQYAILSAFFWMNLHVYSIFSAFSQLQASVHQASFKSRLICCFCGWGTPLIVCSVTLAVDLLDVPILKPNFIKKCGFTVDWSSYLYEHGLVCFSLLLNMAFFIGIVVRARKLAKDVSPVNKGLSKQMCFVAAKLIVIMGFCYITKLIFYGVQVWGSVWEYLDIISALQGVYIFLVYICSVRTLKLLKSKVRKCLNLEKEHVSSVSTTTTCSKETTI